MALVVNELIAVPIGSLLNTSMYSVADVIVRQRAPTLSDRKPRARSDASRSAGLRATDD